MKMVMARLMSDINTKVTVEGDTFGHKYVTQNVLKTYKERGLTSVAK